MEEHDFEEHSKRLYLREEEFLDEYFDVANVAVKVVNKKWQPNYDANNNVRKNHEFFLSTGELTTLVFEAAEIFHKNNQFSSAQIILKSSKHIVNVRVSEVNGKLVGKKIIDNSYDTQKRNSK